MTDDTRTCDDCNTTHNIHDGTTRYRGSKPPVFVCLDCADLGGGLMDGEPDLSLGECERLAYREMKNRARTINNNRRI